MVDPADFPPYSYVPGLWPHPQSDPRGHRYQPHFPDGDLENLKHDPTFLAAILLFNAGYYWESHEAWETLWHRAGRKGPTADLLKALIQLAVVGVKVREGRPDGAVTHAARAAELLANVSTTAIDTARLQRLAAHFATSPPPTPPEPRRPVEIVFDWKIE